MNVNARQVNVFRNGMRTTQNTNRYGSWGNWRDTSNHAGTDKDVLAMKRMLSRSGQQEEPGAAFSRGIVEETISYSETLRQSRANAKNTSLQLKKLHYSFKSLSTQILRSKTSTNARQVAGKARREVIRLKRQRLSGEYDEEELESAITHAQAMERAAKKKARHLQEEEMVKVTGGPCAGELGEKEDQENRETDEKLEDALAARMFYEGGDSGLQDAVAAASQEWEQAYQDSLQMQGTELQEMMQVRMWELQQDMEQYADIAAQEMAQVMAEMSDSMEEMLEESGLSELAEDMMEPVVIEMDPADLKMMKIKHRSEELRAIAKADAEYLKALFDRLEKSKETSLPGISGSNNGAVSFGSLPSGTVIYAAGGTVPAMTETPAAEIDVVSAPGTSGPPAPAASGGFDISV